MSTAGAGQRRAAGRPRCLDAGGSRSAIPIPDRCAALPGRDAPPAGGAAAVLGDGRYPQAATSEPLRAVTCADLADGRSAGARPRRPARGARSLGVEDAAGRARAVEPLVAPSLASATRAPRRPLDRARHSRGRHQPAPGAISSIRDAPIRPTRRTPERRRRHRARSRRLERLGRLRAGPRLRLGSSAGPTWTTLHGLRIEAKRLRYTTRVPRRLLGPSGRWPSSGSSRCRTTSAP